MRVVRTDDIDLINSVINHPDIFKMLVDDGTKEIPIPFHPNIYYLAPLITVPNDGAFDETPVGCMLFTPINSITWNPHIGIFPKYRGLGTQAMNLGVEWMFKNTPCRKIVAHPPVYNKPMIRVFEKCNFTYEGRSTKSVLRDGLLHDRLLMGREK